jgi:hypothetical protein
MHKYLVSISVEDITAQPQNHTNCKHPKTPDDRAKCRAKNGGDVIAKWIEREYIDETKMIGDLAVFTDFIDRSVTPNDA